MNATAVALAVQAAQAAAQAARAVHRANEQVREATMFEEYQEMSKDIWRRRRRGPVLTAELQTDLFGLQAVEKSVGAKAVVRPDPVDEAIGTLAKTLIAVDHKYIAAILKAAAEAFENGTQHIAMWKIHEDDDSYSRQPRYKICFDYVELVHGYKLHIPIRDGEKPRIMYTLEFRQRFQEPVRHSSPNNKRTKIDQEEKKTAPLTLSAMDIVIQHANLERTMHGPNQAERLGALCKFWGYPEHKMCARAMEELSRAILFNKPFVYLEYSTSEDENMPHDDEFNDPAMWSFPIVRQMSMLKYVEDLFQVERELIDYKYDGMWRYKLTRL